MPYGEMNDRPNQISRGLVPSNTRFINTSPNVIASPDAGYIWRGIITKGGNRICLACCVHVGDWIGYELQPLYTNPLPMYYAPPTAETSAIPGKCEKAVVAGMLRLRCTHSDILIIRGSFGSWGSCVSRGGLGGYSESRSDRSGSRVKAFRGIRVGSWNTKWKGYSNKEVNGYKLWYSGSQTTRNEVGVILRACLKDKVVNMNRCNDRIISLTLVIEGETVNVISVYAPQVGLSEEEKKALWDSLDEVVRETSTDQRLILGGDLNRHIGETTEGYSIVDEGFGYGLRNEEGRSILDFATAHDLAVVNSYFKKRDHHLITFQSRGEACYFRHRLLAMDTLFKRGQHRRVGSATPRILWNNLNGNAMEAFRSRVSGGVSTQIEAISASDANSMWNILASIIKDAVKDYLGVAIGTSKTHTDRRESWWLCEEVQYKVEKKKVMFKELITYQEGNLEEQLRAQERYKLAKREAKKVIAHAKEKAYESLYKKLDSKEGENEIFKITKARQRRRWDLGDICFIKDKAGRTVMDEEEIKQRGENTFPLFSTQENQRDMKELWTRTHYCLSIVTTQGLVRRKSLMEKYRDRQRDLHLAFIDLVKAYDSVLQDLKTLIDKGASRRYIKTCGKTMLDIIPNGVYRAKLEVETIINKIREEQLRWFGHVKRRSQSAPVRRVKALVVNGMRRREMDIFAFIHTPNPTKSRRQGKRKFVVVDAGGVSHPPKKLRGDHATPSGASIDASVSATLEREDGDHTNSVAEPNLCTIGAPQRFVISSDSSHHFGTKVAEADVDSLIRSSIPIMTVVTTITSTVEPTLVTKEKFVEPYPFGDGSSSAGETNPIAGVFSDLTGSDFSYCHVCREMVDEFAPLKFFVSVRGMEHDQLFTEFNVGAAPQMSLSSEEQNALDVKVTELETSVESKECELTDLNALVTSVKSKNDNLAERIHKLEMSSGGLQDKVTVYENFMEQLERFQNDRMKVVNDKFDKPCTEFVEMALHLEVKFYPHLFTTIFGRRWLLTQGMKLVIIKCLNSPEYLSALEAAISKDIKKGMQDGLSVRITHGKEGRILTDVAAYNPSAKVDYISALQHLQNVNFPLLAELKSNKDASIKSVINILRLKEPLADKSGLDELQPNKIKENIANQRSALHDVFVPLSDPLSAVVLTDAEDQAATDRNAASFPNVDDAELNIV
nr:hypothetical protein [Tanacetum cinerariifolium]